MAIDTQFGVKAESTYGTAVTVDRFFPLISETVRENVEKLESAARRSGIVTQRDNLSIPVYLDSAGTVEIDVGSKDFGWWLQFLLGSVATAGPTDSAYTHTGTEATVKGKSFTAQFNRPINDAGTAQPFTYAGCKVVSWELTVVKQEIAKLTIEIDAKTLATATALATASYVSGYESYSWAHTDTGFTVAASAVPIESFKLSCDLGLKRDRRKLGTAKQEPIAAAYRDYQWEAVADFTDLTQFNRFKAATNAAQHAALVLTVKAPTLIGATTYPGLVVTIPAARFDKDDVDNSSMDPTTQSLGGTVRHNGTDSAVTMAYTTLQSTP